MEMFRAIHIDPAPVAGVFLFHYNRRYTVPTNSGGKPVPKSQNSVDRVLVDHF